MQFTYTSIVEIQRANEQIRQYFFEPASMRFFKSRIYPEVFPVGHFITSEKGPNGIQAWTIRQCVDGDIRTVGTFQAYATLHAAKTAVKRITL